MEMNQRDYTLETRGTTDAVFIRGPKKDIEKRQATLQLAIRVKGKQIVKPTLIMRKENPAENRYEFPPGLASRKVNFEGKVGREDEFYDERVDVMWQEKAWADEIVSTQYLENFNEQVMYLRSKPKRGYVEKKILVQMDNLDSQNTPNIRDFCWNNDIFILNTPENCTDLRALVDHHLGKLIKQGMRDRFWADFESSEERCNFWCSEAKEYHWRIMYTRWLAESWEEFCKNPNFIMKCAKEVGLAN